jgi:hypothetical protein
VRDSDRDPIDIAFELHGDGQGIGSAASAGAHRD